MVRNRPCSEFKSAHIKVRFRHGPNDNATYCSDYRVEGRQETDRRAGNAPQSGLAGQRSLGTGGYPPHFRYNAGERNVRFC